MDTETRELIEKLKAGHNRTGDQLQRVAVLARRDDVDYAAIEHILGRIDKVLTETQGIIDEMQQ